jgi:hypothetical protein
MRSASGLSSSMSKGHHPKPGLGLSTAAQAQIQAMPINIVRK